MTEAFDHGERNIVLLHGAFSGSWCFEKFCPIFAEAGWTCHSLDLPGHGHARESDEALGGRGIADFKYFLQSYLRTFSIPPVILGHSLGAILAQQLAADGLARALVLVCPAARTGILPSADSEKRASQELMGLGAFWNSVVHPNFDVAVRDSLNRIPSDQQRTVFDRFGPESGRVLFELFFWMFDPEKTTHVDVDRIHCPVLCLCGSQDQLVTPMTARATAAGLRHATLLDVQEHGHMLLMEPGAELVARQIADWFARNPL